MGVGAAAAAAAAEAAGARPAPPAAPSEGRGLRPRRPPDPPWRADGHSVGRARVSADGGRLRGVREAAAREGGAAHRAGRGVGRGGARAGRLPPLERFVHVLPLLRGRGKGGQRGAGPRRGVLAGARAWPGGAAPNRHAAGATAAAAGRRGRRRRGRAGGRAAFPDGQRPAEWLERGRGQTQLAFTADPARTPARLVAHARGRLRVGHGAAALEAREGRECERADTHTGREHVEARHALCPAHV